MDSWIFSLSLIVAGACFVSFIAISLLGSFIEKRLSTPSRQKAEAMMMKLSFALFLILGFSLVPVMVGVFITLLKLAVPLPIGLLEENDMLIVYLFWAVYLAGLAIAFPSMKASGFFNPENPPEP